MTTSKDKQVAFSIAIVVYTDGSYKDKIVLSPDGEEMAANTIFSMLSGQMGQGVLARVEKLYPKQHEDIDTRVNKLYEEFLAKADEIIKEGSDEPVIRSIEVFGSK
jgi:hypothetical protein